MFRPSFIEPENMKLLGFDLIKDENGYLQYQNNGTRKYNVDYNPEFPEPKGKVILYINTTFDRDKYFFVGIKNDGGTRSSYNGICDTEQFLIQLLNSIR